MSLRSFSAGDNILVSRTKSATLETENREWVALTQAAALGAVAAGSGAGSMSLSGTGTTYVHDAVEQNRVLKAFVYRCSVEKIITT